MDPHKKSQKWKFGDSMGSMRGTPPVHNGCLQSLALVESTERLGETGSGREGAKMDMQHGAPSVVHRCRRRRAIVEVPVHWVNAVGKRRSANKGRALAEPKGSNLIFGS